MSSKGPLLKVKNTKGKVRGDGEVFTFLFLSYTLFFIPKVTTTYMISCNNKQQINNTVYNKISLEILVDKQTLTSDTTPN